ncbi:MAG: PACE efflux transporter, partial [Moraxella sp.]
MLIAISIIAMVWTFFYNLLFDKVFTGNKLARPLWLRALHILGFEGGLLLFTLPLVMWVMRLTLLQAFLLDISITLMILVYGFVFYWVYDWISDKFFT